MQERAYVSQFDPSFTTGIVVHKDGVLGDADGNLVTARLIREADNFTVFDRAADHVSTGTYSVTLSSDETSTVGPFRVDFLYSINGTPETYSVYLTVGASDPFYDSLDPGFKSMIESVYIRFADLFDSPAGGPHLQTYFQSHFGRGRMAQLIRIAIGRLNTIAQPRTTYTLEGPGAFPFAQWGPLLEQALYVETIKHLIRSYVEQPEMLVSQGISRADRRDYMQRWQAVLEMETDDLQRALDIFKMQHMGLGRPRVLVAGGIFGQIAATPPTGAWEGRPRFYPVRY